MPQPLIVSADVPGARYEIVVGVGVLASAGERIAAVMPARKAAIVTDSNVGAIHAGALAQSLERAGITPIVHTLGAGESHKTLADLLPAFDTILGARIDRATPVIALGGGVVGDMAGFVAATVLRGVPFVQIPTSLLSMVDASVGGKTGVNHSAGKNLIGAFHQPKVVLIDPTVLQTLPPRELRDGLAECIKHDIIRDAEGFAALERDISKAIALDMDYLTQLIAHNVAIKARVVAADPLEKGERAHLNFGHTFGHAIEKVSKFAYSHGEAVALGMTAATRLAVLRGMISEADGKRIEAVIAKVGLPTGGVKLDSRQIVDAMYFDKKVKDGRVRFVLPEGIGQVGIYDDIPAEQTLKAVESLRA